MIYLMIAILLVVPGARQSDDDCGNGLPCGPIPWRVPALPVLQSPTPFPTLLFTATPDPEATAEPGEPTFTPTPTFTPSPSPVPTLDQTDIEDNIDDIEILAEETPEVIVIDGNEVSIGSLDEMPETSTLWSYVLGLFTINIGNLTAILAFGVFAVSLIVVVKSLTITLPLIAALIGVMRKLFEFILKFIPGVG